MILRNLTTILVTTFCVFYTVLLSAAVREPAVADVRAQNARSGAHIDQVFDTLRRDDGTPFYGFRFPDAFGDDWRNMRFQASSHAQLVAAGFAFPTRGFSQWTSGDPSLLTRVWQMGEDSLPAANIVMLTDTTEFSDFSASVFSMDSTWRNSSSQFVWVDLTEYGVMLDSGQWFHVGYSAILNSSDDSLAIFADDGFPASPYASEWYNGYFANVSAGWPAVNFFIRVVLDYVSSGVQVIGPQGIAQDFRFGPVWPNPFNTRCVITFFMPQAGNAHLSVFDMLGRERAVLSEAAYPVGWHTLQWNAMGFPSGTYFVRLRSENKIKSFPVTLIK